MVFGGAGSALAEPGMVIVGEHSAAIEATGTGSHVVKGLRIFKAGSFKDSRGVKRTWTTDHLQQMVAHYNYLKDSGVLVDVPIRENHTVGNVSGVVGYFVKVYVDPTDPNFLVADIEFTEPTAFSKWERGTFRSRSLEIAAYETNTGETYFPTVVGLAFVDIPAVEGLHSQSTAPLSFSHAVADKETPQMDPRSLEAWLAAGKTAEEWAAACTYAKEQEDQFLAACNYAQALEDHFKNAEQLGLPKEPAQHQKQPPVPPVLPGGQPQPPAPLTFQIGGQMVSDPTQVQTYIHGLEIKLDTLVKDGRIEYVQKLAADNKIPANMVESETEFVSSLSDEQFLAYRKSKDAAPAHPLFGTYGQQGQQQGQMVGGPQAGGIPGSFGPANPGAPTMFGAQPSQLDELTSAEEIVDQHQRSGKPIEFIKSTKSFKILEAAGKAPNLG